MPKSRKCCVVGCDANNRTHRLFNLPKNDKLRELWLSQLIPVNIGLSGLSKAQLLNIHVCQKHFDRHQFDSMGNRLAHGYPCLFTEKEILHGIPLSSLAENDYSDHNYTSQPTFFSSITEEVQHSENSTVSTQSTIYNAEDYKSDHNYALICDMEGSTEASTSLNIDGKCTTVSGLQDPEIMEIGTNQPISTFEPVSTVTNMEFDEILVNESPGLCRCCLSEGCYKDLSIEYTWMDEQEIYADMLLECFDISISQHMEGPDGPNRLICEVCITRLRDASNFKKQVLDSEKKFVDMVGRGEFKAKVVVAYEPMKAETSELQPVEEVVYLPLPNTGEYLEDDTDFDVAPVVLATNPGNEEHPTDSSDDWDILSFENNANVLEDPRKSQDSALIPKESLATISDSIDYRTTRRNDRFKNEQCKHSQGIFSTQLGNHTDRIQYICDVCQKIFQQKASLVSHIRAHAFAKTVSCELRECKLSQNHTLTSHKTTRNEKPFACELCNYKFTRKSSLVCHMRTHTGEKPFLCKLCNYKFTKKSNLASHMRTHTGEKPFACELCNYKCTTNSHLVRHMRTHTGEKPFACELCNYKCTVSSSLVTHMMTHTGEKPFACELCNYKCTVSSSLVTHMMTHTGEKPFACELCNYKCTVSSSLVTHMMTHTGEKPFACELCNYKCTVSSSLVTHMMTHTGEKPFACELCNYKCTVSSSLVTHMMTHTGEKPFACELCNYKCTVSSSLVTHMMTHTGEKPFACELCNYKCTVNSSLVTHMRTHTGEKPLACKLCNYKFTRKSSLVCHMRTHTGEKPFVCKLCNYKFTQKSNLASHMRTHTGEKPFACELCNYKCTTNSHLVKHMRTHTGEKPFACELCNYKCTTNSHLVRHMRTHTGEKSFAC